MNRKGFAPILAIIIFGLLVIGGVSFYIYREPILSLQSLLPGVQNNQSKKEPEGKDFWLRVENIHTLIIDTSDVSCAVGKPENYSKFLFTLMSQGKSQNDLLGYLKNTKFAIESYKKGEESRIEIIENTNIPELSKELQGLANKISDTSDKNFAKKIISNIEQMLPLLVEYHQDCVTLYDKKLERFEYDFQLVRKEITQEEYTNLVQKKNAELDTFIKTTIEPAKSRAWVLKNTLWEVSDRLMFKTDKTAGTQEDNRTPESNFLSKFFNTPLTPLLKEFEKIPLYPGMVEDKSSAADTTGEGCAFECQGPQIFRVFKSDADPAKVDAFYKTELPKLGWEMKPDYWWWEKGNFMLDITPPDPDSPNGEEFTTMYIFEISLKDKGQSR